MTRIISSSVRPKLFELSRAQTDKREQYHNPSRLFNWTITVMVIAVVMCNEEDTGGGAGVTRDEEQVLPVD